jgi:hypothetical protein
MLRSAKPLFARESIFAEFAASYGYCELPSMVSDRIAGASSINTPRDMGHAKHTTIQNTN